MTAAGLGIAAMLGIGQVVLPRGESLWHLIAGPAVDGSWRFVTIDGQAMPQSDYTIGIEWEKIVGGRDGCNMWGYQDDKPAGSFHREIISTLAACADDDSPQAALYGLFAASAPEMKLVDDDTLILRVPGHEARLERIDE